MAESKRIGTRSNGDLEPFLTPRYRLSLKSRGGRGFPLAGRLSSGTFSRIHFRFSSLAAISFSSNSILLASKKPNTSCCCFLICHKRGRGGERKQTKSAKPFFLLRIMQFQGSMQKQEGAKQVENGSGKKILRIKKHLLKSHIWALTWLLHNSTGWSLKTLALYTCECCEP